MDETKLEHFKQLLLKIKNNLENTSKDLKDNGLFAPQYEISSELSNYDNHPADGANELFEKELYTGLKSHNEQLLNNTTDALNRIDNKTFGICTICGKAILEERLEALPYVSYCISCEEEESSKFKEIQDFNNNRPIAETAMDASFGINSTDPDYSYARFNHINSMLLQYGSSDTPQDLNGLYNYRKSADTDPDEIIT